MFGWVAGIGAAGSSVVRWLGTKLPWLGRIFPKMFGWGVAAGVDQILWDLLKNVKINWLRTAIATGLGFVLVFGGETLGSHSDDIIKWINNRNVPNLEQLFINNKGSVATTASMKIGDTEFGHWLQKFASNKEANQSTKGSVKSIQWTGKGFKQIGENSSPDDLIRSLENYGWTKIIEQGGKKSGPATILIDPTIGIKVRIHANPGKGKPYFRVQNKGGGYLDDNGVFPSNASRQELRDLTHFYFGK